MDTFLEGNPSTPVEYDSVTIYQSDLGLKFRKVIKYISVINPQAPVAQIIADEVVFRRFQGEGVQFLKSDLRFLMRIF